MKLFLHFVSTHYELIVACSFALAMSTHNELSILFCAGDVDA